MKKILKQLTSNKISLVMVLLSLFFILISVSSASAASTIYVNTTGNDSNDGSINHPYLTIDKGIESVSENGTIRIANGEYSGIGNTNLTISKNMVITGQSQIKTIINGTETNWIFKVDNNVKLTIQNLTLINGTGNGGAIRNKGTCNVNSCTFTGNAQYGMDGGGGAINNEGTMTVTGCAFNSDSSSNSGGAILNFGAMTVKSCTFNSNSARIGGAICNLENMTLNGCTFKDNTASRYGGAICNEWDGTTCNITGCTFTGNIISDTDYYGGAIYNEKSTLNVKDCTFNSNGASRGGAIYNTEGTMSITNCTFTGSTANNYGSAICNWENSNITTLDHCIFTGNDGNTGIIYNWGIITTINNCTFTNNTAANGGAIFNSETINNVSGCTFTGNEAAKNGGAICNTGTMTVNGCTFKNNSAHLGGAIFNAGPFTARFNYLANNTANKGNAIHNSDYEYSSTDAEYNWWGSNNDPSGQVSGNVDVSPWLVLSISANPATILNTKTSNITINLYKDSNSVDHSRESAKYPSEIPLIFTTTWGSITQTVLTYGAGTATFTANGGPIPQRNPVIVSAADAINQTATVSTNITIKPVANLYIQTTSSIKNPKINDIFKITYKLGNKGPDIAKNVKIIFQLPDGLEFVNIQVDTGNCTYNPSTRTVTWTMDSVPVGDPYLYLTVQAAGHGTYKITPSTTSTTYNLNSGDSGIITINVQPNNSSDNGTSGNTVNAASKTTVGLQDTGLPLNCLLLAVLMVLSGLVPKRK